VASVDRGAAFDCFHCAMRRHPAERQVDYQACHYLRYAPDGRLPSAGLGALIALLLAGQNLNVIGIIAIILLIGIVKKNGIMIVDVALRLEREGHMTAREAVVQASHVRLRPILMTTACAMLGVCR
jgi:hypothetical protein